MVQLVPVTVALPINTPSAYTSTRSPLDKAVAMVPVTLRPAAPLLVMKSPAVPVSSVMLLMATALDVAAVCVPPPTKTWALEVLWSNTW